MSKLSTALAASALLGLAACGGGSGENQASADNSAASAGTDNVTLPPDENAAAGAGDTLGNQLNALETQNALGNHVTDNGAANTAASGEQNANSAAPPGNGQ